ncbi:L-xylulose reductase-like [Brevipalpus obovatus]|uniref:L-xylulose reductase-like n=1 Tax=Brevipalpus obovatus TaxID=246614 RepID=UPI003D9E8772
MDISFNGKRGIVTGAGRGIGRDLVKRLHSCGAYVIAISRDNEHLATLSKECPGIETISLDLQDWDKTKEALSKLEPVDFLVNNAGVTRLNPIGEISEDDCDFVMKINVHSVINVTQEVAKKMKAAGRKGSIVNVSSLSSLVALQDHLVYCASKGAVDQITKVSALELGLHGIRVNSVNPTVVWTDMGKMAWSDPAKADPLLARIPLRKFVQISDVVDAVCYLLSDKADMLSGVILPIDGGYTAT